MSRVDFDLYLLIWIWKRTQSSFEVDLLISIEIETIAAFGKELCPLAWEVPARAIWPLDGYKTPPVGLNTSGASRHTHRKWMTGVIAGVKVLEQWDHLTIKERFSAVDTKFADRHRWKMIFLIAGGWRVS